MLSRSGAVVLLLVVTLSAANHQGVFATEPEKDPFRLPFESARLVKKTLQGDTGKVSADNSQTTQHNPSPSPGTEQSGALRNSAPSALQSRHPGTKLEVKAESRKSMLKINGKAPGVEINDRDVPATSRRSAPGVELNGRATSRRGGVSRQPEGESARRRGVFSNSASEETLPLRTAPVATGTSSFSRGPPSSSKQQVPEEEFGKGSSKQNKNKNSAERHAQRPPLGSEHFSGQALQDVRFLAPQQTRTRGRSSLSHSSRIKLKAADGDEGDAETMQKLPMQSLKPIKSILAKDVSVQPVFAHGKDKIRNLFDAELSHRPIESTLYSDVSSVPVKKPLLFEHSAAPTTAPKQPSRSMSQTNVDTKENSLFLAVDFGRFERENSPLKPMQPNSKHVTTGKSVAASLDKDTEPYQPPVYVPRPSKAADPYKSAEDNVSYQQPPVDFSLAKPKPFISHNEVVFNLHGIKAPIKKTSSPPHVLYKPTEKIPPIHGKYKDIKPLEPVFKKDKPKDLSSKQKPLYDPYKPLDEQHFNNEQHLQANIPGVPGVDYPLHNKIPYTSFSCNSVPYRPGMYANVEAQCQVYHVCHDDRYGEQGAAFLCTNGTLFNQATFSCDWWYNVNCKRAPEFYDMNLDPHYNPYYQKPKEEYDAHQGPAPHAPFVKHPTQSFKRHASSDSSFPMTSSFSGKKKVIEQQPEKPFFENSFDELPLRRPVLNPSKTSDEHAAHANAFQAIGFSSTG